MGRLLEMTIIDVSHVRFHATVREVAISGVLVMTWNWRWPDGHGEIPAKLVAAGGARLALIFSCLQIRAVLCYCFRYFEVESAGDGLSLDCL